MQCCKEFYRILPTIFCHITEKLKLLMKYTDEKNISLAVKGYKIFFSSTSLTLNYQPMAGLKINRQLVVGLNTKNCQLISGRDNYTLR